jgi:hypothetical protein
LARRASAHTKRFELALAIRDGRQALDSALALHDVPTLADVLTVLTAALSMQGESDAAVQLLDRHWPLVETLSDPQAHTVHRTRRAAGQRGPARRCPPVPAPWHRTGTGAELAIRGRGSATRTWP